LPELPEVPNVTESVPTKSSSMKRPAAKSRAGGRARSSAPRRSSSAPRRSTKKEDAGADEADEIQRSRRRRIRESQLASNLKNNTAGLLAGADDAAADEIRMARRKRTRESNNKAGLLMDTTSKECSRRAQ